MAKQHAPTSTTITQTPAVRAGVAPEQQPAGNAAMQQEMAAQSEQGAEGGLFDDLLEWGWEQVGGVDELLAYAAEAGLEAALVMVEDLAAYAPKVLEQLLAQVSEVDELAWAAFEALGSVVVLQLLPAGQVALFLGAIVERDAAWALEQLQQLDPAALKSLFAGLDAETLQRLAEASVELFLAALDAVWQPGLAVSTQVDFGVDFKIIFGFGMGFATRLSVRHMGQGHFELERFISGDLNVGVGQGEKGGDDAKEGKGNEARLQLGGDGYVRELSAFDHSAIQHPVAVFTALSMPGLATFAKLLPGDMTSFATEIEFGNGAYLEAATAVEGETDGAELSAKVFALVRGDITSTLTEIERDGLHARFEGSAEQMAGMLGSGTFGGVLNTTLEQLISLGAKTAVAIEADVNDGEDQPAFENMTLSITNDVEVGETRIGLGLSMEPGVVASLEEFLQNVVSLNVCITTGASHAAARAWLDQARMLESLDGGTWALSAEATLEATLDAEAIAFIAQVVADHLAGIVGSDRMLDELVAWGMNPLEKTPPQALQLLMTEIAMATDLSLTLMGEATKGADVGAGVDVGAEISLDLEKDLLAMGAIVTIDQIGELLKGEAAGRDLQLGA